MVKTPPVSRLAAGLGGVVALMAGITVAVVALRGLFGTGWIWLQEIVIYAHAAVFLLGASVAWLGDDHVRVDVWYRRQGPRRKAWVNLVGTLVFLVPMCLFTVLVSLDYVASSWQRLEGSRLPGGLPAVFLLKTLIPVSALCLLAASVWRSRGWLLELLATRSINATSEPAE